jgi:fibronectin-binding autotransporter adhesin
VNEGTLVLAKAVATAVSGPLNIGNGTAAAVVVIRGTGGNQIDDGVTVTLNTAGALTGKLRLNNFNERIAILNGNGVVENESGSAGTGTLTVGSGGVFIGTLRDGDGVGVDGQLGLTKSGDATFSLQGNAFHTGPTQVNGGVLEISGSFGGSTITVSNSTLTGAGFISSPVNLVSGGLVTGNLSISAQVNVGLGGTLSGTGTASKVNALSGGRVAPGDGVGTLRAGDFTLNPGALLMYQLNTPSIAGGGVNDYIIATGSLNLDGMLQITEMLEFTAGIYPLFKYGAELTNDGLDIDPVFLAAHPGSFIDVSMPNQVSLVVVPEPTSALLLVSGAALTLRRRTVRKATNIA